MFTYSNLHRYCIVLIYPLITEINGIHKQNFTLILFSFTGCDYCSNYYDGVSTYTDEYWCHRCKFLHGFIVLCSYQINLQWNRRVINDCLETWNLLQAKRFLLLSCMVLFNSSCHPKDPSFIDRCFYLDSYYLLCHWVQSRTREVSF